MAKYPGAFIINEVGTRKELASLYGVSERTIYRWLSKASKESGLTPKAKATHPRPSTLINFKGTRKQLAKKYGVSERTAYRWIASAKAKGSQIPSRQNRSKYPGAETIANAVLGGKTSRQIAEDYNVSRSTASRWVRKARLETGEPLPRGRQNIPRPLTPDTAPTDEDIFNEQDIDAYSPENMIEPPEFEPEEIFEEPIEADEPWEVPDSEQYTGDFEMSESMAEELGMLDALIKDMNLLVDDSLFSNLSYNQRIEYLYKYIEFQYDHHPYLKYLIENKNMSISAASTKIDIWGGEFESWLEMQMELDNYGD